MLKQQPIAEFKTEGHFMAFLPTEAIQAFVKEFWILNLSRIAKHHKTELELPNLAHEIIFKYGQDYEEHQPIQGSHFIQKHSALIGIRPFVKASKRTNINQPLILVGVKLSPLGMFRLSNMPLGEFFNQNIALDEFKHPFLKRLEEELAAMVNNPQQIILHLNKKLTSYFLTAAINADAIRFYTALDQSGLLSGAILIKNTGYNYKFWERKFKKYIGITPKKYLKTRRFLNFYHRWITSGQYKYIDLVYEENYFDQNHLIKDFKAMLGCSPNQFLQKMNDTYTQHITQSYPDV